MHFDTMEAHTASLQAVVMFTMVIKLRITRNIVQEDVFIMEHFLTD